MRDILLALTMCWCLWNTYDLHHNYKQRELAAACHCSGNMISCIEKGTRHCNLKMLESIADALGCNFMDLLERSEVRYSRGVFP